MASKLSLFLSELKRRKLYFVAIVFLLVSGCRPAEDSPLTVDMPLHLEEHLDDATIVGSEVPEDVSQPVEWRFDEPQPGWRATPPQPFPAGVRSPTVSQTDDALQITLGPSNARPTGFLVGGVYVDVPEWDHRDWGHVLIRARSSGPAGMALTFNVGGWEEPPYTVMRPNPYEMWGSPDAWLVGDSTVQTYQLLLEPRRDPWEEPVEQLGLWIWINDEPLTMEILSITVFPTEALYAEESAGVRHVERDSRYRHSLFVHTPAQIEYRVQVPEGGRLDTGIGTLWSDPPTTFRVTVRADGEQAETLLKESHGDRESWAQHSIDLSAYAGQVVTLSLEAESERDGSVALWGAPTVTGSAHHWTMALERLAAASEINLLEDAITRYSTDGGETFAAAAPIILPRDTAVVTMSISFDLSLGSPPPAGDFASLTLAHDVTTPFRELSLVLNHEEIIFPAEGMIYRTVPGIEPDWLNPGANQLTVRMWVRNPSADSVLVFAPTVSLSPMTAANLEFQTGPILGAFGADFFTLTARTNLPATVSVYRLETGQVQEGPEDRLRAAESDRGLLHRLRVPRRNLGPSEAYAVIAERDGFSVRRIIHPPKAPGKTFRIAIVGDTRTNVEAWRVIANAVAEFRPLLVVHLGDMVTRGTRDWEWDTQYWEPGRVLLSGVPVYPVIGNHEAEAALYDELSYTPSEDGRARNWAQRIGDVLLIGIDGRQDWSENSANADWLEEVLSESDAEFTFLFSHYPGWSSAQHGRVGEEGQPVERPARDARQTVIPLLSRYGGTAFVAGHDHTYERSELPGGITTITCGGGGAGLYSMSEEAEIQNPYSHAFINRHHFCLLEVTPDEVTFGAMTPEGVLLDVRRWSAKNRR